MSRMCSGLAILLSSALIAACGTQVSNPCSLLQTIRQTGLDGAVAVVPSAELTDYQRSARTMYRPQPTVTELFALETSYPGAGSEGCIEITVTDGQATLRHVAPESKRGPSERYYYWRTLEPTELAELREFVAKNKVDHQPSKLFGAFDGVEYRWTHATGTEAWQVVLNNPSKGAQPENDLIAMLTRFRDAKTLTCQYPGGLPEQAEILYAQPMNPVRQVWAKGSDVRAFIESTPADWYTLKDGQWKRGDTPPGANSSSPYPGDHAQNFGMDVIHATSDHRQTLWRDKYVASGTESLHFKHGTYLIEDGKPPEKLFDSEMEYQIVVPDTNLLLGTLDTHLLCYDLEKRQRVSLQNTADLDAFQVFEYIPELKGVLLVRHPQVPYGIAPAAQWRLLDVESHGSREIASLFSGFPQRLYPQPQRLQPASTANQYWVAWPDPVYHCSHICRIDRKTLQTVGLNAFPVRGLLFESADLWVDEATRKAYLIHEGNLFRIPVPDEALKATPD